MKCIVTGGCGFIGSHIVDSLISKGHSVTVIDDLSGSCDQFYYNSKARYQKNDISDYNSIEPFFKGIDVVFHLAAESRIQPCIENPLLAVSTNVVGTTNVLQASRINGVKRVIYSSTSSVYGLNMDLPTKENTPVDCLNPYSSTKYAGEEMCKMYTKLYQLDTCIFRYFNVYGERSPTKGQYSPVIGLFLKQNLEDNKLQIMGDGQQRRDFIHVSDVAEINVLASEYSSCINGKVFNVGYEINYSILEIASKINNNIIFNPPRIGEAKDTLSDCNLAKNLFGWKPKISLTDWIKSKL